jgi:hypothetical protein
MPLYKLDPEQSLCCQMLKKFPFLIEHNDSLVQFVSWTSSVRLILKVADV